MDIVLVNPQIPQNTGSIARTCAATQTPLHLVGKIGFDLSEKAVRRAGLDYWPWVPLSKHQSWEEYLEARKPPHAWFFSKFGTRLYSDAPFGPHDALVFGSETKGLGEEFLSKVPADQILRIPIVCDAVRSLNLSNAVSIALYEGRRQLKLD
ncbi:MAG: tRNA (cytidine(34)-2'-O)-methyltransferase [Deltaproteobacteria bacterium]|nr:tRNA (cytidine(34)-2'-O)-methyltransferase [Deltaproteobacteria bacterium]